MNSTTGIYSPLSILENNSQINMRITYQLHFSLLYYRKVCNTFYDALDGATNGLATRYNYKAIIGPCNRGDCCFINCPGGVVHYDVGVTDFNT